MVDSNNCCIFVIEKENNMKPQKITCTDCINKYSCQMGFPAKLCPYFVGKKETSVEEKVAIRKEVQRFRKKVAKMYK